MQEKIFFKDSEGNMLCGILSASSKNRPIIILCHGFTSSKDGNTQLSLGEMLNEKNISTFRIDLFAHGESEGKIEDITVSKAVDDILSAIKLLKDRGYKKIGLFGSSFGGIASIIAASKAELFVLALKCPVSNFEELAVGRINGEMLKEWKNNGVATYEPWEGFKITMKYNFFEDMKNNNGYEAAKRIKIPMLIVHGDRDDVVPIEQSRKTAGIIRNCRLEIIKGAGHGFEKPEQFEKMVELITDFIADNSNL